MSWPEKVRSLRYCTVVDCGGGCSHGSIVQLLVSVSDVLSFFHRSNYCGSAGGCRRRESSVQTMLVFVQQDWYSDYWRGTAPPTVCARKIDKLCTFDLLNLSNSLTQVDQLARMDHSVVGSVRSNFNIGDPLEDDVLKATMWEYLGLTRVYTKRKGKNNVLYWNWPGARWISFTMLTLPYWFEF